MVHLSSIWRSPAVVCANLESSWNYGNSCEKRSDTEIRRVCKMGRYVLGKRDEDQLHRVSAEKERKEKRERRREQRSAQQILYNSSRQDSYILTHSRWSWETCIKCDPLYKMWIFQETAKWERDLWCNFLLQRFFKSTREQPKLT